VRGVARRGARIARHAFLAQDLRAGRTWGGWTACMAGGAAEAMAGVASVQGQGGGWGGVEPRQRKRQRREQTGGTPASGGVLDLCDSDDDGARQARADDVVNLCDDTSDDDAGDEGGRAGGRALPRYGGGAPCAPCAPPCAPWEKLRDAIVHNFNEKAGDLSFEELYRTAYNMCLQKQGDLLYSKVELALWDRSCTLCEEVSRNPDETCAPPHQLSAAFQAGL